MTHGRADGLRQTKRNSCWRLTAAAFTALALFAGERAHAEQPVVEAATAQLLSPSAAEAHYGGSTTHTNGLCQLASIICSAPRPPEVRELVRSLSEAGQLTNAQFAANALAYIRANVETEFRYGLSKGGFGALLDGSGTPFDQAHLLVELLRERGVSANYQVGAITLSGAQFASWTGLTNAAAACRLLADGGVPATINGVTDANCAYSGAVATITVGHIWVSANGLLYDPSFRVGVQVAGVTDLAAVLGCGTAASPTCGSSARASLVPAGASYQGNDGVANYVQNLQTAAMGATLNGFAANLQHHIESTAPDAQLEAIVGGRRFDTAALSPPAASLPYPAAVTRTWSGDIPDQYRSRFRVQFDAINTWLYGDETAGYWIQIGGWHQDATRRAVLIFEREAGSGAPLTPNLNNMSGALDYAPQATNEFVPLASSSVTFSSTFSNLTIEIDHPYAAENGAYLDRTITNMANFSETYPQVSMVARGIYIVQAWGRAGSGALARQLRMADDKTPSHPRLLTGSAVSQGASMFAQVGAPAAVTLWLSQSDQALRIDNAMGRTITQLHATFGHVSGFGGGYIVDGRSTFSVTSMDDNAAQRAVSVRSAALLLSVLEGSALEQSQDIGDGGSTVSWFRMANSKGMRFYDGNASNIEAIFAASPNYSEGATSERQFIRDYVNGGFNVILPNNGDLGTFGTGSSYFTMPAVPVFAYRADDLAFGYSNSASLTKGSTSVSPNDPVTATLSSLRRSEAQIAMPTVDLATGAVNFAAPPDIVSGAGDFPYSLPLQRFYDSQNVQSEVYRRAQNELNVNIYDRYGISDHHLRSGWRHNWEISADIANDGSRGLGRDRAIDASSAVAAIYAIRNLQSASTFQDRVSAIFVARWMTEQFASNVVTVTMPPSQFSFTRMPDGRLNPQSGSYARLVQSGARSEVVSSLGFQYLYTGITFLMTRPDGSQISFSNNLHPGFGNFLYGGRGFRPDYWNFPNGVNITFDFTVTPEPEMHCTANYQICNGVLVLTRVRNNLGRSLEFDTAFTGGAGWVNDPDGYNDEYLVVTDDQGRQVRFRDRTPGFGAGGDMISGRTKVIGADGSDWRYIYSTVNSASAFGAVRLTQAFSPLDASNPIVTIQYDGLRRAASVTDAANQTTLYYPGRVADEDASVGRQIDALGGRSVAEFGTDGRLMRATDALSRATQFQYDSAGRQVRVIRPEGDSIETAYDARSNVISTTAHAKPGLPLPDVVTSTVYSEAANVAICVNAVRCNLPVRQVGPRGFVSRYGWDSATGLLTGIEEGLNASLSCALEGGVCPKSDFVYGVFGSAPNQFRLLTQRTDRISSGTDLVRTFAYNSANRYTLQSSVEDAGGLALATGFVFDGVGNLTQMDGPRTDVSDVVNFTWDAMRRLRMRIDADPDGAGSLPRPAERHGYNAAGWPISLERGTTTLATGTNFTTAELTSLSYDAAGRAIRQTTPVGVEQTSYDALNRPLCVAIRMNAAVYASLPSSACVSSTLGTAGPDRIRRFNYDALGQVLSEERGVGSSVAQTYATYAYTQNGLPDWVEDANGNRTDYAYDGFDRLYRLYFPQAAVGARAANVNDYEQYGYDASNNRVNRRLRSGETIVYGYDALNREVLEDMPAGSTTDVYFGYDLLGRRLYARFGSASGAGVSYAYDAPGRLLSETSYGRALAFENDAGSNRTRITWADGNYIQYTYDAMNRMDQVRENGAESGAGLLADYAYDTLGRRGSIARGNGAVTSFSYDAASRPSALNQDVAGSAQDVNFGFSYNRASQITTRTLSNASYIWMPSMLTASYTRNGLNQYTNVGGTNFTNDTRGNLTSDGARAFCYDLENRLVGVAPAASNPCSAPSTLFLAYDPLGRLRQSTAGSANTDFLYDGDRLSAEYDGASLLRRYAHGAGVDEPLVWYEGAGLGDRRWLLSDHLGSVVAAADGAGGTSVYTYGPWGEPAGGNWTGSRFRYTGQIALPDAGLYHYKARVYDPYLGRFLQTDPVGYEDDLNLYAYVRNDPLNSTDPSGRQAQAAAIPIGEAAVVGCLANPLLCGGAIIVGAGLGGIIGGIIDHGGPTMVPGPMLSCQTGGGCPGDTPAADESAQGEPRPAPPANDGVSRPHGAPDHDQAIDDRAREVRGEGATDIRKNQTQVDAQGNRVGNNRPDLGYTDRSGTRHNEEWGRNEGRVEGQGDRARQNDPNCVTSGTCLP